MLDGVAALAGLPLWSHAILRILPWLIADLIGNELHLLRTNAFEAACRRLRNRPHLPFARHIVPLAWLEVGSLMTQQRR